jgi:hypothetical protein
MKWRLLAALAPLCFAACDDGTVISHVDKLPHMQIGDLVTMQEEGGLLIEIHGTPWPNVTDAELADHLRPPAGAAQEVKFRSVPPGQWVNNGGRGHRLVLHFNPTGAPNSAHDCMATAEIRTRAPSADGGFTVNASFCTKDQWVAHGYLEAPKVPPGDWAEYTRVMQNLFLAIFRETKER